MNEIFFFQGLAQSILKNVEITNDRIRLVFLKEVPTSTVVYHHQLRRIDFFFEGVAFGVENQPDQGFEFYPEFPEFQTFSYFFNSVKTIKLSKCQNASKFEICLKLKKLG